MLALHRQCSCRKSYMIRSCCQTKTKEPLFSVRPNNLQATCPTDTHIETKHTHTLRCPSPQRQRQTDRYIVGQTWGRSTSKPWLSRQEVGRGKKTLQCSTDQRRGRWVSLFGRVESGGVASPNLTVLHGWVGSRGEVWWGGWVGVGGWVRCCWCWAKRGLSSTTRILKQ